MKDRLYNIMDDLNDVLCDIDSSIKVIEIQFNAGLENCDMETINSILWGQMRLLKNTQTECCQLYGKIDKTILDIKHECI